MLYNNENRIGEIFLYDLDSAHGTIINKQRVPSRHFTKLRVGDQLKFGESTRTYVLLGPEEPQPEPIQISKPILKSVGENSSVTWLVRIINVHDKYYLDLRFTLCWILP